MADAEQILSAVRNVADGTINMERVATIAAGTAVPGTRADIDQILSDVFDPATNTLRYVEVI